MSGVPPGVGETKEKKKKEWWQQWWFIIGAICVVLVVGGLIWWRHHNSKKGNEGPQPDESAAFIGGAQQSDPSAPNTNVSVTQADNNLALTNRIDARVHNAQQQIEMRNIRDRIGRSEGEIDKLKGQVQRIRTAVEMRVGGGWNR